MSSADAGLPSGLLNTTQQVGGSIGLAVLATVATTVANDRIAEATAGPSGPSPGAIIAASVEGYGDALLVGAAMCVGAMLVAIFMVTRGAGRDAADNAAEGVPAAIPGHV